jgi:hypothetical protein
MGGSPSISKPDNTVDVAMLGLQQQAGRDALARQNALDVARSAQPIETQTIDIYGPQGALNQMSQVAAVNAYKSKELEKMSNPYAAAAREELQKQQTAPLNPNYWQKTMQDWGKGVGF